MTLFGLIFVIALVGLLCWAVTELIPMDVRFKKIIYVVAIVFIVLYVLQAIGGLPGNLNPRIN